jgi:NADPH-dependent 2,4-dienoyl-CoA reductase/sulfur reductase-like enzyme
MKTYTNPVFEYRPCPDQRAGAIVRRPIVVVGAGPVGLCTAIDLAANGTPVVVLTPVAAGAPFAGLELGEGSDRSLVALAERIAAG